MICPNCEKEIEPNQPQCPHCGCHFQVTYVPKSAPKPEPAIEKQPEKAEDLKEKATKTEAPEFPDEKATLIEAPETAVEQVCPECGKPVPLTARFCKWCGSPLSKEQDNQQPVLNQTTNAEKNMPSTKICGNCGRTIKATASFCKWCGNPCNDKNKEEE